MKRIQIDLLEHVHEAMTEQAAKHGHRLKPFLEFIISVQAGHVPPPQVQPVKVRPEQDREEKPTERKPAKVQPEATAKERPAQGMRPDVAALAHLMKPQPAQAREEEAPKRQPKPWTPNRNVQAYTEEVDPGSGIFTDGKSFAVQVGPVGRQKAYFFEYIHEAEEFLANEVF